MSKWLFSRKRAASDYTTMNVQTQGVQPQYDVIKLDQHHNTRHQTHDYENAAAAVQ